MSTSQAMAGIQAMEGTKAPFVNGRVIKSLIQVIHDRMIILKNQHPIFNSEDFALDENYRLKFDQQP